MCIRDSPKPPQPKPEEPRRCFFDPTHRGPFEEAEIRTAAGTKNVVVCRLDAERLRRGEQPDPRMIEYQGRRIPAAQAPRSHGGLGLSGVDIVSLVLQGMAAASRIGWGGSSSRRSSRSGGFGGILSGGSSRRSSGGSRSSSRTRSSSRSRGGRRRRR